MSQKIQNQVNRILAQHSITEAPIPVDRIVQDEGIVIRYAPSDQYSGMLLRAEDGAVLMGVNNNEAATRMRYTIAHEYAHFLFDSKDDVTIDYRGKEYVDTKPQKEVIADKFAACLLMPEEMLRKDFTKIANGDAFLEKDLIQLASRYKVSRDAMRFRLINLGLLQHQY